MFRQFQAARLTAPCGFFAAERPPHLRPRGRRLCVEHRAMGGERGLPFRGGEVYFALAKEWRLRRGPRSFPRRPAWGAFRPTVPSTDAISYVRSTSIRDIHSLATNVRSESNTLKLFA